MEPDTRIPGVLRQVAQLQEVGPEACTEGSLSDATGYDVDDLRTLMAEALAEQLVDFDPVRQVWSLTTEGWESIETV
jgi:hypothetical protein